VGRKRSPTAAEVESGASVN